jgi:hypothetical protein
MTDITDTHEDTDLLAAEAAISGLIELIEFFTDNPKAATQFGSTTMYAFSYNEDDWKLLNKQMRRFDKKSTNYDLEARRTFGKINLVHCIMHEKVCEKKVTGTKTVVKRQLPEGVEYTEVEVEEDIVEWVCPPEWR